MEASRWYLDTVIREFKAKGYENLRLDGFYWYDEVMHYDVDPLVLETVQGVTDYVHSLENVSNLLDPLLPVLRVPRLEDLRL
jgi:hypothetical protein